MMKAMTGKSPETVQALPNVKVAIELEIDGEALAKWEDFLFHYEDLFYQEYIGGWASLVDMDDQKGLLICEAESFDPEEDRKKLKAAVKAWHKGKTLPFGFFVIDKEVALKSFIEGVKEKGMDWQDADECDGLFMDWLIQKALFGSVQYG